MIMSLANLIVDHDAAAVAMRTRDTMRYVQTEWNKAHREPIDVAELHKFLCDEHYGDLTQEQKEFVRARRDEVRNAYAATVCGLLCGEMLHRIWLQTSRPTAACSARMEMIRCGRFIGPDNRYWYQ